MRTQIYLPEYEYKRLKDRAKVQDKTFAQVIRDLLRLGLSEEKRQRETKKPKASGAQYLLQMAKEAERLGFEGPRDMSTTVDEVIYGLKK